MWWEWSLGRAKVMMLVMIRDSADLRAALITFALITEITKGQLQWPIVTFASREERLLGWHERFLPDARLSPFLREARAQARRKEPKPGRLLIFSMFYDFCFCLALFVRWNKLYLFLFVCLFSYLFIYFLIWLMYN